MTASGFERMEKRDMHTKLVRTALVGAALAVGVPAALTVGATVAGAHTPKPPKLPNSAVAGFENSTPGSPASVSTTLVVPAATCSSASSGLNSGVTIWDSPSPPVSSVAQSPAGAELQIQCLKGSLIEFVSASAGLASFRFPVNAGDSVNLSASQSGGTATASATDTTTATTESASSAASGTPALEVLGATNGGTTLPVIIGGSIGFSAASFDGTTLSDAAVPINMVRKNTTVLTTSASSSGAFTITQP